MYSSGTVSLFCVWQSCLTRCWKPLEGKDHGDKKKVPKLGNKAKKKKKDQLHVLATSYCSLSGPPKSYLTLLGGCTFA